MLILVFLSTFIVITQAQVFKTHYLLSNPGQEEPEYVRSNLSIPNPLSKRSITSTFSTRSFKIELKCDSPYGDTKGLTCAKVTKGLRRATERLERVIYLNKTVTINFIFSSFCTSNLSRLGQPCAIAERTLGYAAPTSWHQVSLYLFSF